MNRSQQLRGLPSVDEIIRCDAMADLRSQHPRSRVTTWVRESITEVRQKILAGESLEIDSLIDLVIRQVRKRVARDNGASIQTVINGTGVLLHTNLGRAPLADRAIDRVAEAARYANVELNLDSGRRSRRGERLESLLKQVSGAEDALVVNNCAAATVLVLQAIVAPREVIVSRGQLVEIGGGFRLPDVFRSAGVTLREIGTTNRTYLRDYQSALSPETGAILRVHRSNFQLQGFVTEPTIDELAELPRAENVPVIDDLGSGCMQDLSSLGLSEPTVTASVASGADLTLFSGDKLFGGPQSGIIVGRSRWVDRVRKHPLMRALRVDKLVMAALEATTEIHLSGTANTALPIMQMLTADPESIHDRAIQAQSCLNLPQVEVVACQSQVGGGSIPGVALPSFGLKIHSAAADRLANLLRLGSPPVQPRVTDDSVVLDLRTVRREETDLLIRALRDAMGAVGATGAVGSEVTDT